MDELLAEVFKKVDKPITINDYSIKTYSSNKILKRTTDIYLFFIWNEKNFQQVFENNFLSNKRIFNFIFYLSDLAVNGNCSNIYSKIKKTLTTSWRHNRTRNVLVNTPCYCSQNTFYYYNSFFFDNGRGQVTNISIYALEHNGMNLFPKLQNFKGYPIRTSVFARVPTSIKYKKPPWYVTEDLSIVKNYGGFDGLTLVNMAHYLNFTPLIRETVNGYGWKESNGTYVGSLGEVIYGRVDMAANSRFYEHFESENVDITSFITKVRLCFIAPKSNRIPQWMQMFMCFSYITWTVIFLTMLLLSLTWFLIQQCEFDLKKCTSQKKPNLCVTVYSVLFLVYDNFPSSLPGRILLSGGLCMHIILTAIFQGNLATSFSIISFFPDINTLNDLLNSDLMISTNLDILDNATSPILKALRQKKTNFIYSSSLDRAAYYKDVCAVERKMDAELLLKTEYVDKDGLPLLHIVDECPVSKPLIYLVAKESPFLPAFNTILQRFAETGLIDKWYTDFIKMHLIEDRYKREKYVTDTTTIYSPVKFTDVEAAFYLLIFGNIVSLLAFAGEFVVHSCLIENVVKVCFKLPYLP